MKNLFSFYKSISIVLFLLCPFASLLAQDILWEKSYGGKHAEYLFDVIPTPDYGFILAGSSLSKKTGTKTDDNRGDLDYWVWKMDDIGEPDWQKSFGGSGQDMLRAILLTNDGGFLLAGSSQSDAGLDKKDKSRGGSDFWIIKLDARGNEVWQKTIGGSGQDELTCIVRCKDGGFVLGGSSASTQPTAKEIDLKIAGEKTSKNFGGLDYWVVKIDSKGDIKWQNSFGGIYNDELRSIALTQDGGYLLGGSSNSPASPSSRGGVSYGNKKDECLGQADYWIIKLDDKGTEQWQKVIGGKGDDQLYVVHQTSSGTYILGGNSNSESGEGKSKGNESGTDFWLVAMDSKQEVLWQETYNIGKVDVLTSLVENDDHTILLGGYAQGEVVKSGKGKGISGKVGETLKQVQGKEVRDLSSAIPGSDEMKQEVADNVGRVNDKAKELSEKIPGNVGQGEVLKAGGGNGNTFGMPKQMTSGRPQMAEEPKVKKGTDDYVAIKITDKGEELWRKSVGSDGQDILKKVIETRDGGYLLAGTSKVTLTADGGIKATGDKSSGRGSTDFWVVKLKDKDKPKEPKKPVEAIPNPATDFTNVIVGYDYTRGTATLVDLAGHILHSFAITDKTIPIDLKGLPEGIYIVNIRTDVQNSGVKVIKQRGD